MPGVPEERPTNDVSDRGRYQFYLLAPVAATSDPHSYRGPGTFEERAPNPDLSREILGPWTRTRTIEMYVKTPISVCIKTSNPRGVRTFISHTLVTLVVRGSHGGQPSSSGCGSHDPPGEVTMGHRPLTDLGKSRAQGSGGFREAGTTVMCDEKTPLP